MSLLKLNGIEIISNDKMALEIFNLNIFKPIKLFEQVSYLQMKLTKRKYPSMYIFVNKVSDMLLTMCFNSRDQQKVKLHNISKLIINFC